MSVKDQSWIAIILILTACADAPVATVAGTRADRSTVTVSRGEFRDILYLSGEVESAGGETIVVPRIPNWQTSIRTMVADGTKVTPGTVVAELDSTQFSSGIEQRRQSLADSVQSIAQQLARNEAELRQKEFDLEDKRVALEKAKANAIIPKEILALRDWEENQLALKRAEAQFEKAKNDLESSKRSGEAEVANLVLTKMSAERDIAIAEEAIEALTLRANREGVVVIGDNGRTGRKLQVGDTVWVGMKLATIPDLSSLRVMAVLVDVDDGRVETGMPVNVVVDAFPDRTFRGKVASIALVADSLTRESLRRGFDISIVLEDADRDLLRPGYSVRAAVERAKVPDALLIDRAAVDFSEAEPVVRKPNGSVADGVRIGDCNARECVVLAGLEAGDRLAVATAETR
jgi:hypothetical protein